MLENELRTSELPVIPEKRYFTIGEVSDLCRVKTHVLRYWEQEFKQLNPVRRGNRRYYRRNDVILIRHIRSLLYDQRFTIDGARSQLSSRTKKTKAAERQASGAAQPNSKPITVNDYQKVLRQTIATLEDVLDTLDGIPS